MPVAKRAKPDVAPSPDPNFDEHGLPWLENGERLDQPTFHERYLQTPEGFKAELIEGVVYVRASPISKRHGRVVNRSHGWLFHYCTATPGTDSIAETTTILGPESEPQPDGSLLILPEYGGQIREEGDYFRGSPELVVEVAYSSRSLDLHAKLRDYERGGAREYLVHTLTDGQVHWFERREGRLVAILRDPDGLYRSRILPGLWLDPAAFASDDKAALIASLNRGLASPEHDAFAAELARRRAEIERGPAALP